MNPKRGGFRYFVYIEPVIRAPLVKTYGFPILTIAAIAIFALFAIKPTVETILTLQKDLANQKEILASATIKSENLSKGITNYRQIDQEKLSKIQTAIPDNPRLQTIINTLEEAAKIPQASVSAIQFQSTEYEKAPNSLNTLKEVGFTYNIEGSFNSLKQILQTLQTASRLITIEGVTLNKLEGSNNLLMSVLGKAYYLK